MTKRNSSQLWPRRTKSLYNYTYSALPFLVTTQPAEERRALKMAPSTVFSKRHLRSGAINSVFPTNTKDSSCFGLRCWGPMPWRKVGAGMLVPPQNYEFLGTPSIPGRPSLLHGDGGAGLSCLLTVYFWRHVFPGSVIESHPSKSLPCPQAWPPTGPSPLSLLRAQASLLEAGLCVEFLRQNLPGSSWFGLPVSRTHRLSDAVFIRPQSTVAPQKEHTYCPKQARTSSTGLRTGTFAPPTMGGKFGLNSQPAM